MQLAIIITQKFTRDIRLSSFQHVLKMSFCSTNASDRRWHDLPTARSLTARLKRPTCCWCIISVCQLRILKQRRSNSFSMISWSQ